MYEWLDLAFARIYHTPHINLQNGERGKSRSGMWLLPTRVDRGFPQKVFPQVSGESPLMDS
jgi:hypothetical protein